jgi:hypothetical protein
VRLAGAFETAEEKRPLEPEKKEGEGAVAPAAEPPKYVTEEQLEKLLSTRLRSVEGKVEKTIAQSLDTFSGKLKTDLAALVPAPPPAAGAKPDKKEGADPELKKLQDQIASLTKQADDARSERDTERANARDARLRQRVGEALGTVGIDGLRARHAVGLLCDVEKRVRWTDDGDAILFRTSERDDADLEGGVRAWVKTDDAKLYLPPKGSQGSGDRPGAAPPAASSSGPPDRRAVAEGLRRALLGQI